MPPRWLAPMLTDYDLHLLAEGRHWRSYEKLGAHRIELDGRWPACIMTSAREVRFDVHRLA